jgi:hypothetical protein
MNYGKRYAWLSDYNPSRVPQLSYIKEFKQVIEKDRGNYSKFDCFLPNQALIDLPPAIRDTTAFNIDNCVASTIVTEFYYKHKF